jgi:hypothetical protein
MYNLFFLEGYFHQKVGHKETESCPEWRGGRVYPEILLARYRK